MRFPTILPLLLILVSLSIAVSLPNNHERDIPALVSAAASFSHTLSPGGLGSSTHTCAAAKASNPTAKDMADAALWLFSQPANKICKQSAQAGKLCTLLVSRGGADISICGPWNSTIKCKEAGMLSILHILGFCKKKVQGVDRVAGIVYDGGFQLVHE